MRSRNSARSDGRSGLIELVNSLGLDLINPRALLTIFIPLLILAALYRTPDSPIVNVLLSLCWHVIYAMEVLFMAYLLRMNSHYPEDGSFGAVFRWSGRLLIFLWFVSAFFTASYAAITGNTIVSDTIFFVSGFFLLITSISCTLLFVPYKEGWGFIVGYLVFGLLLALLFV